MYKIISIPDLKSILAENNKDLIQDLKNYKLCYIDDIPETEYRYTPEALAYRETEEWKKENQLYEDQRKNTSYYNDWMFNPILRRGSECADFPNPDYIPGEREKFAYFTPISLDEQWGDDWNDTPYEHNAGTPYDEITTETKTTDEGLRIATKRQEYIIIEVPFIIKSYNTMYPEDWGNGNSPFCVRDINQGGVAWVFDSNSTNNKSVCIHAGVNPFDFVQKLEEIEANNPEWEESTED